MALAGPELAARAASYDLHDVTRRYARNQKLSMTDASLHEREFKRYMTLVAANPGKVYGMCGPVDDFWHLFITFTLKYQNFCDVVAHRFIHHFPNENEGDRNPSPTRQENFDEFIKDYTSTFGERPPAHVWPFAMETAAGIMGCSTCRCCIAVVDDEEQD